MNTVTKIIVATTLLFLWAVAAAGPKLVNGDGSVLSQTCIAAVESREALRKQLAMYNLEADRLRCNGMPLSAFVQSMNGASAADEAVSEARLIARNSSPFTKLCIAAARSRDEFERVKSRYFARGNYEPEDVACNGMPLDEFARKYRVEPFKLTATN